MSVQDGVPRPSRLRDGQSSRSVDRDLQIASLLRAGKTIDEIKRVLRTSHRVVTRVRSTRRIPVPLHRTRRSRAELDDLEAKAVTMLRAGATQREIYAKLRVSPVTQAWLRKVHRIPVQPPRGRKTLPADERTVTGRA